MITLVFMRYDDIFGILNLFLMSVKYSIRNSYFN